MQTTTPSLQLPAQLSTLAPEVDWLYDFVFWTSVAFFVAIVGTMVVFLVQYRRRPGVKAEPSGHNNVLELVWTFGPVFLLFAMFHWSFQTYIASSVAPDDALNIRVRASQWVWAFEQPNGVSETGEVHVPADRAVRLVMSSDDVLHSFFVPDFRVKRDAVPGMFTSLWFQAVAPESTLPPAGSAADGNRILYQSQVFCTEYCGTSHSGMLAQIMVQRREDYEAFLAVGPQLPSDMTMVEWGHANFQRMGCTPTCHSDQPGGPTVPGPNLHGIIGTEIALEGGERVTVDAAYLERSIREPQAQIVEGYNSIAMSHFRLGDAQVQSLVEYISSLH